ncbi:MAG: hypothetical protein WCY11_20045 [Novosphingobium sp.]
MRETLDPWIFITVSYALGVGGTAAMIGWSWIAMRRAEARRDRSRRK